MYLKGKVVTLRSLEHEDIEMLRILANDPWYESMIVGWAFPISKKDQEEWFNAYKASDKMLRFIIETDADGAVGMTGLQNIDWKNGVAEGAGMRVARKELRSHGIATDAYFTLFRYAFNELRLHRIDGCALAHNIGSLKATAKVGFKQEGVRREAVFKDGKFHDVVMLGVLKEDYEKAVEERHYWDE